MSADSDATAHDRGVARLATRRRSRACCSRYFDVVAVEGEGSWLIDVDGRRYLDLASGIAVTNIGHCHPRVVAGGRDAARRARCTRRWWPSTSATSSWPKRLARAGALAAPTRRCSSATRAPRRSTAPSSSPGGSPAGRASSPSAAASTAARWVRRRSPPPRASTSEGYEPARCAARRTIAPYAGRPTMPPSRRSTSSSPSRRPPHTVAAMIVEPVLGEGGYVVAAGRVAARACASGATRHGILLVFDEVQTGIGRTGRPFAAETFGVQPDVVLFAKGVASGLPLGGIIAARPVFDRWPTGTHGSTFGGNPVSCAAALATLDVLDERGPLRRGPPCSGDRRSGAARRGCARPSVRRRSGASG